MRHEVGRAKPEILLVDSGPRDGLTAIPERVSSREKALLINSLAQAGVSKIDCVAFTHPRLIPANADAEDVARQIQKKQGVTTIGLVASEIGCRRAVLTGIDELLVLVGASEAFNQAVLGLSIRETLNRLLPTIFATARAGRKSMRGHVLAAFGCPYSGPVSPERVGDIVSRLAFMGAREIALVDSTGMANPRQVKELISGLLGLHLEADLAVQFHNTRGTGLVNCFAAYEVGVRLFDTAIGGLSTTPFGAPRLDLGYWNIPTEDLVHFFEGLGVKTGIQIDRLMECVDLAEKLAGRPLPGHLLRAGPTSRLQKAPERVTLR